MILFYSGFAAMQLLQRNDTASLLLAITVRGAIIQSTRSWHYTLVFLMHQQLPRQLDSRFIHSNGSGRRMCFCVQLDIYVFCCWIGEAISCSLFFLLDFFLRGAQALDFFFSSDLLGVLSLLFLPNPPFYCLLFLWRSPCSHFTEKKYYCCLLLFWLFDSNALLVLPFGCR
jgi:hypothetical protein